MQLKKKPCLDCALFWVDVQTKQFFENLPIISNQEQIFWDFFAVGSMSLKKFPQLIATELSQSFKASADGSIMTLNVVWKSISPSRYG